VKAEEPEFRSFSPAEILSFKAELSVKLTVPAQAVLFTFRGHVIC